MPLHTVSRAAPGPSSILRADRRPSPGVLCQRCLDDNNDASPEVAGLIRCVADCIAHAAAAFVECSEKIVALSFTAAVVDVPSAERRRAKLQRAEARCLRHLRRLGAAQDKVTDARGCPRRVSRLLAEATTAAVAGANRVLGDVRRELAAAEQQVFNAMSLAVIKGDDLSHVPQRRLLL